VIVGQRNRRSRSTARVITAVQPPPGPGRSLSASYAKKNLKKRLLDEPMAFSWDDRTVMASDIWEEVLLHMRPRDAIAVTIYPTLSTLKDRPLGSCLCSWRSTSHTWKHAT
jgi:hypothetical protein